MSIVKDIQEFSADFKYSWSEFGPITAVMIALILAARLLIPVGPLVVIASIAYLATRHQQPATSDLKIFLGAAFVCSLVLGTLAAYLMGWASRSDDD